MLKRSRRTHWVLSLFLFIGVLSFSAELPIKDLDQTIDKALKDWNIAGLAIAIVKDGQVVHLKGYGYKNVNDKTLVDENTIFGIGSTSKALVQPLSECLSMRASSTGTTRSSIICRITAFQTPMSHAN